MKSHFLFKGPGNLIGDNPVKAEAGAIGILVQSTDTEGTITVSASAQPAPINLALNKTTTSSTQESWNPATNATDGSEGTRWAANSGATGEWLQVDLGQNYNLTGSEVVWEFDGRIYEYNIQTSSNGSNWTTVVNKDNNTSTAQTQSDSFTSNNVRYVRINITGLAAGTWASISEFRIYDGSTTPALSSDSVQIVTSDVVLPPTPTPTTQPTDTPTPAPSSTYYVDCSASNNGNGSQSSPWNNLNTVNGTTFTAGSQILFKRGTRLYGDAMAQRIWFCG